MKLALIAAAIAVVAVPITVQGAEGPTRGAPTEKRICDVNVPTGSRLGGVRRCRTEAEREAARQEARQVVDRVQAMKPTLCAPPNPC